MVDENGTGKGSDGVKRVGELEIERRRLCRILGENDKGAEKNIAGGQVREGEREEEHDEDNEELAHFEDDTDSFMLRKREFCFAGLPPGTAESTNTRPCVQTVQHNWYC